MTPTTIVKPSLATLGGVRIANSSTIIDANTKLNLLLYCNAKYGKTTTAASLNALTLKFGGKPSLFVAVEAADGGGTMSIQDLGVDYVMPSSWNELVSIVAALQSDKTYGGVVVDNLTDLVKRFIQPYALGMPYTKGAAPETRKLGVPEQGDYQTMAETLRGQLNQLMNLTKHKDMAVRKHLICCALSKDKLDRKTQALLNIQPDLPGAMAGDATAMFNTVAAIDIKSVVGPDPAKPGQTTRLTSRVLVTAGDGVRLLGDRTKCFPASGPTDLCEIWEKYFIPRIEASREKTA